MKTDVQFAESLSADFNENTWTFEMKEDFRVFSGEFAILPKDQFEKLIMSCFIFTIKDKTNRIIFHKPVSVI